MRSIRSIVIVFLLFIPLAAYGERKTPLRGTPTARLRQLAATSQAMRVVVGVQLPEPFVPDANLLPPKAEAQRRAMAHAKLALLTRHPKAKMESELPHIPYAIVEIDAKTLADLIDDDAVTSIEENFGMRAALFDSASIIAAPTAWNAGWTGSGLTIVDIDSGFQINHPFFSSRVVQEACFSRTQQPYLTSSCSNGGPQLIGAGSAGLMAANVWGFDHGTHTLGIAAGSNAPAGYSGIARGASIIAIKGASINTNPTDCGPAPVPCAWYQWVDVIDALNKVYEWRTSHSIAAVNMSFGGGIFSSRAACDTEMQSMKDSVNNLRSAGIAVVAATGNDGSTTGIIRPACVTGVIAVGATSKDNTVWASSNSAEILDLWAPGSGFPGSGTTWGITSSLPGSTYGQMQGTSMAAPHVTGAFAILKQRSPNATVDKLLDDLKSTGLPITRAGVTRRRIDVDAALARFDSTAPSVPGTFSATADGSTVSVCWQASSDDYGVKHYVVERRIHRDDPFEVLPPVTSSSCWSESVVANTAYEYRMKAVDTTGNSSAYTTTDFATTVEYTNDPVQSGTGVYGAHISQLRRAIDAWRHFTRIAPAWSDYTALSGGIMAADVAQFVARLNESRQQIGLALFEYSVIAPATNGPIARQHIQELRDSMR